MLARLTSRLKAVRREMTWHQGKMARDQPSVPGYHRGFAHTDMIPAEVWGKLRSEDKMMKLSSMT